MNCIVTAGPAYEPLDDARRLTNFSTGTLGSHLSNHLVEHGHQVTLLLGEYATYTGPQLAQTRVSFGTAQDLSAKLRALAGPPPVQAVFHLAAVSDFTFGQVWKRTPSGERQAVKSGKYSSRHGVLLVELVPAPKIIAQLRNWFPQSVLVGWKFEVEGDRTAAIAQAREQIADHHTDACVANGPAYGSGFGFVRANGQAADLPGKPDLFATLLDFVFAQGRSPG